MKTSPGRLGPALLGEAWLVGADRGWAGDGFLSLIFETLETTMTKREFDLETKINYGRGIDGQPGHNWGSPCGGRTAYRREMRLHVSGIDYLSFRAWRIAQLRRWQDYWEPTLATLGRGSPFRAPQVYRRDIGLALLGPREFINGVVAS
jgi:hypothetical protein